MLSSQALHHDTMNTPTSEPSLIPWPPWPPWLPWPPPWPLCSPKVQRRLPASLPLELRIMGLVKPVTRETALKEAEMMLRAVGALGRKREVRAACLLALPCLAQGLCKSKVRATRSWAAALVLCDRPGSSSSSSGWQAVPQLDHTFNTRARLHRLLAPLHSPTLREASRWTVLTWSSSACITALQVNKQRR